MDSVKKLNDAQAKINSKLLKETPFLGAKFSSDVLPLQLDPYAGKLTDEQVTTLVALEKKAANIAIKSLASLARAGDLDHLGGGLELIPSFMMTLAMTDYDKRHFTIEHGHTAIGYYSSLAALGFLDEDRVVDAFRRSLDIAGHVSWVPGGTELNSGRLGVMMPAAVGQAVGVRAHKGKGSAVVVHTGDAGWVSGQALNGFIAASLHKAPTIFIMHRNGIQLSNTTENINPKDPREVIGALGIEIIEVPSLHDKQALMAAYAKATKLADDGKPSLIYPVGYRSEKSAKVTLDTFAKMFEVEASTKAFAAKNNVAMDTEIWIPGSLMSFRDEEAMLECLFFVNELPGGHAHHDGGMKGRDEQTTLAGSMLQLSADEKAALKTLEGKTKRKVVTEARPAPGTPNLVVKAANRAKVQLPGTDEVVSARAGSEAGYALIAEKFPKQCFFVACDLDPSTKLGKASSLVPKDHHFEMSIQEQASSIMANGLALSSREPQLNVFATFTAFLEGIAREGFEMWRYQRNLNGVNEGLNVVMHLAHVGSCTGRDHFSGWSLDWINLAIGYMPYVYRFYAPADARAAFIATCDAAASYGGHLLAISRDNLPILTKQGSSEPFWNAGDDWEPVSLFREFKGAKTAILSIGGPSYLAGEAAEAANDKGVPTDAYIINGLPLPENFWADIAKRYDRVITIEDGLIGNEHSGLRGFAGLTASNLAASTKLHHFGITDPGVAPSDHFSVIWEHFQMTKEALLAAALTK